MPFHYEKRDEQNIAGGGQTKKGQPASFGQLGAYISRQRDAREQMAREPQDIQVVGSHSDIEFLLAWNAKADLTKILAFSSVGVTAFGIQLIAELIKEGKDYLKNYPNLTAEQWRWIRETGHPFAIGNYWEENSQGKPLVFVNVYGHGILGLLNMTVADALFPNSPLLALVAASLMYTNFELFGEGSIRARYEPNDFFISNLIPMLGSQAFANLFGLKERIPLSVVASAQALVYALCSGKKMTKEDWLKLAPYPVLVRLIEVSPIFKGRSALLDAAFDHIRTTFGFSQGIGPYTGVAYSATSGNTTVTTSLGLGPGGQRASITVGGDNFSATAYGERAYLPQGGTDYRVGAQVTVQLARAHTSDAELATLKNTVKRDVSGVFAILKERAPDKDTAKSASALQRDIENAIEKATDPNTLANFRGDFFRSWRSFQGSISQSGKIDKANFEDILATFRTLLSTLQ